MFQIVTLIIALISAILPFIVYPAWAWIPIILVDLVISVQLWAVKNKYRFKSIADMSPEANALLQRYGHYFAMPFASKDFSASAATSQFAGIVIAIICLYKNFWWAIAFAIGNWFLMGFIATVLSPASLLAKSPALQIAHDEIVEHINSQRNHQ